MSELDDGHHFANLMTDTKMRARLLKKVTQIVNIVKPLGIIEVDQIISNTMKDGDETVITALSSLIPNRKSHTTNNNWLVKRANKRATDVDKLFSLPPLRGIKSNAINLLDIGAGDAHNTVAIGIRSMNLNEDQIYAIDIPQWGENRIEKKVDYNIKFEYIDPTKIVIPFDVQFNRIMMFQSLHHIRHLSDMLYEVNRVAAPGAIVIIREHDCQDKLMSNLIDIEHMLYDVVIDNNPYKKFIASYYGKYRSRFQWTDIFESFMFRRIDTKSVAVPGETNYYYAIYQKVGNAKPLSSYSIDTLHSIYFKIMKKGSPKTWKKSQLIIAINNAL